MFFFFLREHKKDVLIEGSCIIDSMLLVGPSEEGEWWISRSVITVSLAVSEGDASLDSTSNGAVGVPPAAAAAVNLGVGEAYVQYVDHTSNPRETLFSHANGQM